MPINSSNKKRFLSPTCLRVLLGLLLVAGAFQADAGHRHKKKAKGIETTMTVVAIRPPKDNETFVRVSFTPSQRFYKLPNDANPAYLELLKASEKDHTPVIIRRAKEESDIILSVRRQ